jgi:hypothetical protein
MQEVVALDSRGQWQKGNIVSFRGESSSMVVKIHFYDKEPDRDEWIVYKSKRIRLSDEEGFFSTSVQQNSTDEAELSVRNFDLGNR